MEVLFNSGFIACIKFIKNVYSAILLKHSWALSGNYFQYFLDYQFNLVTDYGHGLGRGHDLVVSLRRMT